MIWCENLSHYSVDGLDYVGIGDTLSFPACVSSVCSRVEIIEDTTAEEVETFNATLTPGVDFDGTIITLDPTVAVVEITDANSELI